MTPQEFAQKIKSKYPQYNNLDDEDLARRIIQKYPQYSKQVNFAPTTMTQAFDKAGIQPSMFGMAKQAVGETLKEDLPGVGKYVEKLRNQYPGQVAEKLGSMGVPAPLSAAAGLATKGVGEVLPKTGGELALQGFAGPALEAAGAVARPVISAVKETVPSVVSALTRINHPFVKRAWERGGLVAAEIKKLGEKDVIEPIVTGIKESMKDARRLLGQKIGRIEDKIVARNETKIIPTADIGTKLEEGLSKAGFNVPGYVKQDVNLPLSGDTKTIISDFNNLQGFSPEKISPILGPKGEKLITPSVSAKPVSMNFKSALNLRRKIDRAVEFINKGSLQVGTVEESLLKQARKELNERLLKVDPLFKAANDAFSRLAQAYSALESDVLSGKEETVANRISRLFQKGTLERRMVEKLDIVSKQAGMSLDRLLDILTAQKFGPGINPAVTRAAQHTGGGLMPLVVGELGRRAIGGPKTMALGAAGLAATSPRLNFAAMQALKNAGLPEIGALTKNIVGQAGVKIPPKLARLMRKRKQELTDTNVPLNP